MWHPGFEGYGVNPDGGGNIAALAIGLVNLVTFNEADLVDHTSGSETARHFIRSVVNLRDHRNNHNFIRIGGIPFVDSTNTFNDIRGVWRAFEFFVYAVAALPTNNMATLPRQKAINYIKQKFINSYFKHVGIYCKPSSRLSILNSIIEVKNARNTAKGTINDVGNNISVIQNAQAAAGGLSLPMLFNVLEVDILLKRQYFYTNYTAVGPAPAAWDDPSKQITNINNANPIDGRSVRNYDNIVRYYSLNYRSDLRATGLLNNKFYNSFITDSVQDKVIYRRNGIQNNVFKFSAVTAAANGAGHPDNAEINAQEDLNNNNDGDETLNLTFNIIEHWYCILESLILNNDYLRENYRKYLNVVFNSNAN